VQNPKFFSLFGFLYNKNGRLLFGWPHAFGCHNQKISHILPLSLYRLFATIDENKDGHLTHGEMTALVVGIQFEEIDLEHNDAVRRIMADFDTSRNQLIDEEEFVNGVCRWLYAARRSRAPAGDAGPHTVKFLSDFHTVCCALLSFVNLSFSIYKSDWDFVHRKQRGNMIFWMSGVRVMKSPRV
jgi:hypothetical protein